MEQFNTPTKNIVTIPPSPFLKRLGYGTGVNVYKFNRSPKTNFLQSPWAVKIVKSKENSLLYNKRLRDEASLLRKMKHPNIVGFRQFCKTEDGKQCLAMEECSNSLGGLIELRLEELNIAFRPDKILKLGLDIANALDYLHTNVNLLHGDLKSHNILVQGDFVVCKLCDFGVSLPLNENGDLDIEKNGGEAEYVGTVCWSAPEVLKEPPMISNKADIFSYGLILWEMMALDIPHSNQTNDELDETEMFDESVEVVPEILGTRPAIPFHMLGEDVTEYNDVLSIFYFCTESEPKDRLNAHHLSTCIHAMKTS